MGLEESGPKEEKRIIRRSGQERARLIRAFRRSGRSQRVDGRGERLK